MCPLEGLCTATHTPSPEGSFCVCVCSCLEGGLRAYWCANAALCERDGASVHLRASRQVWFVHPLGACCRCVRVCVSVFLCVYACVLGGWAPGHWQVSLAVLGCLSLPHVRKRPTVCTTGQFPFHTDGAPKGT